MNHNSARFEIIDSDGHVVEPPTLWRDYAEPAFREQLDVPGGGGVQVTAIARAYPDASAFLRRAVATDDESDWRVSTEESWKLEALAQMGRPGGHDPHARLVDMDDEGIDAAVLYPTAMLSWVEEADLFGAGCRAYNSWLRDYCSASPGRLYGVGVVPVQDIDAAKVEMRRCVDELGFKAVMIRPARYREDKKLNDPFYDPFWQAAAELGLPIGVHPSPHADMANTCRLLGLADGATNPAQGLALRQSLTNALDLQLALAYFTLGGICERHPELRVAFLEGTGGWIVPMLERFDHQFKIFGSHDQRTLPSELFARQCMISFDPDEITLAFTAEQLGADKILWASDYPHPDAKIPGVVRELEEAVESLPAESQRLILGATARNFYSL